MKILVVDDDNKVLIDAFHKLKNNENKVFLANGGPQSQDILSTVKISLIISDAKVYNSFSAELLKYIRENKIAVVLMSSVANEEEVFKAFQEGVKDFIIKPIDFSTIFHRLEKVNNAL